MSASFPNSWEPYGSSQQSQALGWRKPANGAAKQPTLSDRWKNAQAKVLQSSILPSRPTPPAPGSTPTQPKPQNLDLASFHQAEHEHRILARHESIRTEIREVASSVRQLSTTIDASRDHHDATNKLLQTEIASLHGALTTVREQVNDSVSNRVTEEQIKDIVETRLTPLTEDAQASSRANQKVDENNRLCKDIKRSVNSLFDHLAQYVSDNTNDWINRQLIPVLDQSIQRVFDDYIGNFEAILNRMEDRIKVPTVSYGRDPFQGRSETRYDDCIDVRNCKEEPLFRKGNREDYAMQFGEVCEGTIRGHRAQRLAHEDSARDYRHTPDSRAGRRPIQFDIVPREDVTACRPAPSRLPLAVKRVNRGTQRTATSRSSTQERSRIDTGNDASAVWVKVRIRPKVVAKNVCIGSEDSIIDLTRTDDSDGGEEANLFEESEIKRENVEKSPKVYQHSGSENNVILVESSSESDTDDWSPDEVYKSTGCPTTSRRYRAPYFTRSVKKRRHC